MLETQIKQMAQLVGSNSRNDMEFSCAYDFVARLGKEYTYAPLPKRVKRMTPQMCFYNAMKLAISKKLTYVEGYCAIETLPLAIHHAWCCEPGSNVAIDPTAEHARYFFGVPFKLEVIKEKYKRAESCMSLLDDWEAGFPLLRMTEAEARQLVADTV